MSKSERRILNNKLKRRRQRRKNIFLFFITALLVTTLSLGATALLSNAKSKTEETEYKYYKSIIVKRGDTLLSIAIENMDHNYAAAETYVEELIKINGLRDDKIIAGNYLIIPYFSEELKLESF